MEFKVSISKHFFTKKVLFQGFYYFGGCVLYASCLYSASLYSLSVWGISKGIRQLRAGIIIEGSILQEVIFVAVLVRYSVLELLSNKYLKQKIFLLIAIRKIFNYFSY